MGTYGSHDPDTEDVCMILWSEGIAAFHTAGQYIKKYLHDNESPIMISILANADTLTFFATILSIMCLGHMPFTISIRNSVPAVTHLMKATNSKYFVVTPDGPVQKIVDIVCHQNDDKKITTTIPMPTFSEIFIGSYEPLLPFKRPDWKSTAFIMHSSGTTRVTKRWFS
ncbi:uncharacterized protein BT62DRAFT_921671 [Guyanagaster necrorhizus]|uniref:AMP-dependent synthetase/ligase domain-containing protein n=1 Tax=Guyanagaster necrorhizus TaxID=856835 RepID=A0A9P7VPN6_9AGAR|nr:uncharacterized protein BT62DRAFT_921671 [Guyanagaster necrorhizus MCA 3950]KAG7443714.1 hypothetical protein BT62DRAFT_921671 [Guyanagaster necrorhizus MCA 3950]